MASLQGLGATLLAMGQTRLALLATELEEEKQRLLATLAWGAVALLLGCMACLFLAAFVTVLFWDTPHRLLAMACVTLLFAAGAAWAAWRVRQLGRTPEGGMLSASLAELEADCAALALAASRHPASSEGRPGGVGEGRLP